MLACMRMSWRGEEETAGLSGVPAILALWQGQATVARHLRQRVTLPGRGTRTPSALGRCRWDWAAARAGRAATLSEVAGRFDRDVATLSEGVQRVRFRATSSAVFREILDALRASVAAENP